MTRNGTPSDTAGAKGRSRSADAAGEGERRAGAGLSPVCVHLTPEYIYDLTRRDEDDDE